MKNTCKLNSHFRRPFHEKKKMLRGALYRCASAACGLYPLAGRRVFTGAPLPRRNLPCRRRRFFSGRARGHRACEPRTGKRRAFPPRPGAGPPRGGFACTGGRSVCILFPYPAGRAKLEHRARRQRHQLPKGGREPRLWPADFLGSRCRLDGIGRTSGKYPGRLHRHIGFLLPGGKCTLLVAAVYPVKRTTARTAQCTPPFCLFFFSHSGPGSFYGLCLRKPQILNQGRRPSGTFPVKRYRRSFCRPGIIVPTPFLFVKQIRQIFSSFSKIFVLSNKFIKNPLCTFCRSVVYCMTSKSRPPHEALLSKGADV